MMKKTYQGVQLLRFIAALMVVLTHATFYFSTRIDKSFPVWAAGAQGVSIFFVISGFVMMLVSKELIGLAGGYKQFVLNRLIRIVPVYWLVNSVKLVIWFALPSAVFTNPNYINILLSYFFIPAKNLDGLIEPFYGVGWTLNFEMFFYGLFALSLFLNLRATWFVGTILLFLSLLSIFKTANWPVYAYYVNPIVLNFLYGIFIAEILFKGVKIPRLVSILMVLFGAIFILVNPKIYILSLQYPIFVAGVIFLEPYLKNKIPRPFLFAGDTSYSLYLVHPMIGPFVAITLFKMHVINPYAIIFSVIFISILLSSLMFVFFEKPASRYLRNKLLTKPMVS